ncbi:MULTISPECIES: Gfo/Idh/MocA family oxidoreductase [unclassified Leifsonia]|uniref:Gfo/Idh/MocA family protein n=1 Tax=unclassified Leifsonia TaxID=2663824 RepID=UPI0008A800FF|nr:MULTISPECIES: Gfo/Idh/MocA family oxidoreductase [unclassified Leifsonia]SEI15097.1 Predicted dehydrogenase [Leifsonia sp. CL154]SFM04004.1 Predicted dehydrogenase [Leifsonia sp. CL147]
MGVGVIGAGMISDYYLENLTAFPDLEVVAIGDIDVERARVSAEKHGVPTSGDPDAVLNHPDVELVVNLTIPAAHAPVSIAAIAAGKHVWTEKPLATDRSSGRRILEAATAAGVRVGSAPDTVLGPGFQTAKRAIEAGLIGEPLTAITGMQYQGPDWAHPNPDFLFAPGGGPLFDMGPYYFSGLIHLFGAIDAVAALGTTAFRERSIRVGPRAGDTFPVAVPTHVSVLTQFEAGQTAQSTLSFDTPLFRHGVFEVNGTEGTLVLPDPNMFSGEIHLYRPLEKLGMVNHQDFEVIPEVGVVTNRGLGVLDMARAIRTGADHIATGELGFHVLDTLVAVEEAIIRGEIVSVESSVPRIPSVPADFDPLASTLSELLD